AAGWQLDGEPLHGEGPGALRDIARDWIAIEHRFERGALARRNVCGEVPFGATSESLARHAERRDLSGEFLERPKGSATVIGGAPSGDGLGLYGWRAVAEAVADVSEHVRQLGVGIGIHRHHGCAVVDAIHIALQAVKQDRNR